MADTFGTKTVNGQMIPVFQGTGLYGGNGVGTTFRTASPPIPQTIPLGGGSVGDGGASAAAQPLSLTRSPLPLLFGMLIVGLLGLRYIHWRRA